MRANTTCPLPIIAVPNISSVTNVIPIDIDKLQERRQKKQKTYWQRIKNDPVKFDHYKEWRKQYVNKKKEKEARALSPPPIVAVPFKFVRI